MMRFLKLINLIVVIAVITGITAISAAFAATDPLYLGVGARSLGMGKAYVAFAEDGETIFMNPAGLGTIDGPKLTSMYANLLNDVRYAVLGGTYPTEYGVIGGGLVSTGVSDIALYDGSGSSTGTASYGNNVLFLSYGFELSQLAELGIVTDYLLAKMPTETSLLAKYGKNIYLGGSLKYFTQGGSGVGSAGNGSGIDLDVGVLYKPNSWLSLGLCQQNLLPMSFGGSMSYSSGVKESIPSISKLGARVKVLGEGGLYQYGNNEFDIALDYDMHIYKPVISTAHIGAEYWVPIPREVMGVKIPKKMLAIRAGLDQDPGPDGVINNITAGIGLRYAGVQFDYAYHSYNDIPENATHYFSISYVGGEEKPVKKPKEKKEKVVESAAALIEVEAPADKLITRDKSIEVRGSVLKDETVVEVNALPVDIEEKTFIKEIGLEQAGKHLIVVRAQDKDGTEEEVKRRVLRLVTFMDVAEDHWAIEPIGYCGTAGLIEGYPDGTFRPNRALSRAELATLLVRAKGEELPEVKRNVFPDIPKSHWAAPYIQAAKDMGLVKGYPDGTFKPNNEINKVEGVVVLARFNGAIDEPVEPLAEGPYKDLVARHWAAYLVLQAQEMELLEYITGQMFWPKKELSRAEVVEILSKTIFARDKIRDLLDWEVGFEEELKETPIKKEGVSKKKIIKVKQTTSLREQILQADELQRKGEYTRALTEYKSILSYLMDSRELTEKEIPLDLARNLEKSGEHKKAIKEYKRAIQKIIYGEIAGK